MAMDREALWAYVIERNQPLKGERVSMSVKEFRRFYDLVWDRAEQFGREQFGREQAMGVALFNSLFGGQK